MNNADLAEIRAMLQANAAPDRRARAPLFGALRSLLPSVGLETRTALAPPRRVGLRPSEDAQTEAEEPMLLDDPAADDPASERRHAFGQRHETAIEPAPVLLLAAPLPPEVHAAPTRPVDDADVAEAAELVRRRGLRLASAMLPVEETPYHPEDLDDVAGEAAAIYAECGLFEPEPAATPAAALTGAERALLQRLEATFLAELAALRAAKA